MIKIIKNKYKKAIKIKKLNFIKNLIVCQIHQDKYEKNNKKIIIKILNYKNKQNIEIIKIKHMIKI